MSEKKSKQKSKSKAKASPNKSSKSKASKKPSPKPKPKAKPKAKRVVAAEKKEAVKYGPEKELYTESKDERAPRTYEYYAKLAKDAYDRAQGAPVYPFTKEIADEVLLAVATSPYGLERICKENPHFPSPKIIYTWRYKNENFRKEYALAKQAQADLMADFIVDISDDASKDVSYDAEGNERINGEFVARSRLRIDTRKWYASKVLPKIYGNHLIIEDDTDRKKKVVDNVAEKAKQAKYDKDY